MPEYIDVIARHRADGGIVPLYIIYQEMYLPIDRILDVRRAASLKAGGCGMRYLCRMRGRDVILYLEAEGRWFFEPRR